MALAFVEHHLLMGDYARSSVNNQCILLKPLNMEINPTPHPCHCPMIQLMTRKLGENK